MQALAASCLTPAAGALAGAAALTAASVAVASVPAKASLSGSVLILSTSVNGGSSSTEAQQAAALGLTVTVATPSTWDAMHTSDFQNYNVIVIGDPSGASCSSTVPSDALSTAGTWGTAVKGHVAVLGTAPVLAATPAATTLISDAIAYAASSGSGKTGLYVSLNCEYASASDGTDVPLLASVEGGGFTVTGQGSHCPSDAGTVNTWQALALSQFNGMTSADLGPWSSPACSVQETFTAFPSALSGLGYYAGASPASFTAADGTTGQAYLLAGSPASTATAALAPSTGGEIPGGTTTGGGSPAAPGATANMAADPVNTENGDFTESASVVSIPTFGPSLDFVPTYDAQAAQAQTQTGKPGPLGYGWTDNWATSLTGSLPVPGDMYTIDGLAAARASGGATQVPLDYPQTTIYNSGNVYIADTAGNRIEEVAGAAGTQWGISMTAGNMYTVAGSPAGNYGDSPDGTQASQSLLLRPTNMVIDQSGNLFIADSGNNRVVEIPAVSGQDRGNGTMTVNDLYTIAGHAAGNAGHSGDGNNAAQNTFLNDPVGLATGSGTNDLYIADAGNNRVQEIPASTGTQWGQSMTKNDMYTVAGDPAGSAGRSGNGTALGSSLLTTPEGVSASSGSDLYIADTGNNRVVEAASGGGSQWGITMTANDLYTVAGHASGASGTSGDGGASTGAYLNGPTSVVVNNGTQMYIADSANNRVQEAARTTHTEWGISMAQNDIYTVAGSAAGTAGFSGDGGAATSALLNNPGQVSAVGTLYIADTNNNRIRQVSGSGTISEFAGTGGTLASSGNGGPAINAELYQPTGQAEDASGNIYIADAGNNRVQEIAASSHTQWGIVMTAGDVYTVAGSAKGKPGLGGDGGAATSAHLSYPNDVALDAAGNLYIADSGNNRVQEVSASTGNISTIAGSASGTAGKSGDGGAATSALLSDPVGVIADTLGDVYIADTANNRIQEIYAASGHHWNQTMTAGDIYTVAGSSAGTAGHSGDGGAANSALLNQPQGVTADAAGNLYIADTANNRVQEVAVTTGVQRGGPSLTANDIYTIAGSATGTSGVTGDLGPATSAFLNSPSAIASDPAGNLYIGDGSNRRIQEIAAADGIQWGQQMQAGYIYTIAGSATGVRGEAGDGGPATAALMSYPEGVSVDPSGNLYFTDKYGDLLREVVSDTSTPFPVYPTPGSTTNGTTYPGGVAITQENGSQVTFYPLQSNCFAPYTAVQSGQYCTLPENVGVNLSYSGGTYAYTPSPGFSFTYNSAGQLTGETDAAGDTLTVAYGTPLPGQGNCPATATWCQLITSASGRALTIGYNAANFVTSATDPMSRRTTYAYTGSDLTSVTDPMSRVTSYTYGAGTTGNPLNANNLLTITEPNGQPGGPDAGAATVNVYDYQGRVTSQTDPMGYVTSFNYCLDAPSGNCLNASTGTGTVTTTQPGGRSSVDAYLQGALIATTQKNGSSPSVQYYGTNVATGTLLDDWTADSSGAVTRDTYDPAGNVTSETDPLGNVTTMWPTSMGAASCAADATASTACSPSQPGPAPVSPGAAISTPSAPPAGVTYALYDTTGKPLYTTTGVYQPGSNNASGTMTSYTLYNGNSVTVNGSNVTCAAAAPTPSLPCATIDTNGAVTQYGYDPQGDVISTSTPDGNGSEKAVETFAYNADGQLTSDTSPDGNLPGANAGNYTTVTAYNSDGETTSVTDAGGSGATLTPRTTSYGYDGNGNQVTVTDPRSHTTTASYDADDDTVLVTDPAGHASLTCYDSAGFIAHTVPPSGVADNNLTPASCPASYPAGYGTRLAASATTYTYNALGQETSMTTPAPAGQSGAQTTTMTYNAAGLLATTTYPPDSNTPGAPGLVTSDIYDKNGQLTSETVGYGTAAAATTSYCHDPNGNQTAVVPPDGNASGTAPCETSSPWVIDPNAHGAQAAYQTTYTYDSAGDMVSTTSPATTSAPGGATTTATYNSAGDLLTSTDPNGVTATYAYDSADQNTGVSYSGSSAHSVTYGYDAEGNATSMTDATGTSSYVYDPFGELTSVHNGSGQTVGYGYDGNGNITSIAYPLPPSATWAATNTITYGYDNADRLTAVTDFNGHQITIGNTADGAPNSLALGSTGDTITTSYDNTGAPAAITLKSGTTTLLGFTYADAPSGNILSETDTPGSAQSPATYAYDGQGRLTSMTPGSGPQLGYGYDPSGNLTTTPTGATGTYDKASELTSSALAGTTTSYTYDPVGRRLTAKQNATIMASATWNGAGQLTAYSNAAGAMTAAVYDGNNFRASATTGGTTRNFTWDATSSSLLMDSANAYIYGPGGTPAEQVSLASGSITYLASDSLGSVRGVVSNTGSLVASTSYDAWGNPVTAGGLSLYTPFGYAGGYTDPTGLIYDINRYYDPSTGQFLSSDPAVDQTGQPYAYAGGNPVSNADPTGLWAQALLTGKVYRDEAVFEAWVAVILGVPAHFAQTQYVVNWQSGTPANVKAKGNRRIDIYQFFPFYIDNEVKTGKTYNGSRERGEALRDHYLVQSNGATACHPNGNNRPTCPVPTRMATWWFSARGASGCQVIGSDGSLCSSGTLRKNLRDKHINRIYFYLVKKQDRKRLQGVYGTRKARRTMRRALMKAYNQCPTNMLETNFLPILKFEHNNTTCNDDSHRPLGA